MTLGDGPSPDADELTSMPLETGGVVCDVTVTLEC